VVHISDTHWEHGKLSIPPGDILIHSGDFTNRLRPADFVERMTEFNEWLGTLPHRIKILVTGNHELWAFRMEDPAIIRSTLSHAVFLEFEEFLDPISGLVLFGFSYGTPKTRYREIPRGIDVLISHVPAFNVMDLAFTPGSSLIDCQICHQSHKNREHWGDHELTKEVVIDLDMLARLICVGRLRESSPKFTCLDMYTMKLESKSKMILSSSIQQ
jgi:hypothetical protein